MKLAVAFAVYVLLGGALAIGILKAVAGSPWVLLAAVALFLFGFIRYGCRTH